jgi:hypothetical protein
MRENETVVRYLSAAFQILLAGAISQLSPSGTWSFKNSRRSTVRSLAILDREAGGDEDLIKSVEAQLAKMRIWAAEG